MLSSNTTIESEYEDFLSGYQPDFTLMSAEIAENFIQLLEKDPTLQDVVDLFNNDLDQMAYCALYAFSQKKLSRSQIATILEYRMIKKDFEKVIIKSLEDTNCTLEVKSELKKYSRLEQSSISFYMPISVLHDPRLKFFVNKLKEFQIIDMSKISLSEIKSYKISMLGVTGRNIKVQLKYGENAKHLFHRLGQFNFDDIERSVFKYGRYAATDFPGISCGDSFHLIKAHAIFLTLHDELHRILASTVPNIVYDALLYAVQVVRNKTGIHRSKEIWTSLDMEVSVFYEMKDQALNTSQQFAMALNAQTFSGRYFGLFTASPYIDTTWLLIIDMVLNSSEWEKRGINFRHLLMDNEKVPNYSSMYHFVLQHINEIENEISPARQIAIMKALWFCIPRPDPSLNIEFVKKIGFVEVNKQKEPIQKDLTEVRKRVYLQVHVEGKPLIESKLEYLKLKMLFQKHQSNGLFIHSIIKLLKENVAFEKIMSHIIYDTNLDKFKKINCLTEMARQAPNYKQYIIQKICAHKDISIYILDWSNVNLKELILLFHENKKEIIELIDYNIGKALADTDNNNDYFEWYKKIVSNPAGFIHLLKILPHRKDELLKFLFEHKDEFARLVKDLPFPFELIPRFPDYKNKIVEGSINAIVNGGLSRINMALYEGTVCSEPDEYRREIINAINNNVNKMIFSADHQCFEWYKNLITTTSRFIYFSQEVLPIQENNLLNFLLNNKEEFNRLIKDTKDCDRLQRNFSADKAKIKENYLLYSKTESVEVCLDQIHKYLMKRTKERSKLFFRLPESEHDYNNRLKSWEGVLQAIDDIANASGNSDKSLRDFILEIAQQHHATPYFILLMKLADTLKDKSADEVKKICVEIIPKQSNLRIINIVQSDPDKPISYSPTG